MILRPDKYKAAMKRIYQGFLLFSIALALSCSVFNPQQRKTSDAANKKAKIEREQKKNYQEAREKTVKHRREIQTEATRKRMDEVDKKAKAYNNHDKLPWYKRIFMKKKH
jgi:hypothetical protein